MKWVATQPSPQRSPQQVWAQRIAWGTVAWLAWTRHVDVSWKRARHKYKQALEMYMAERSELLGKLNGNDEQTGA